VPDLAAKETTFDPGTQMHRGRLHRPDVDPINASVTDDMLFTKSTTLLGGVQRAILYGGA